ncbi:MAG TPA: hypothetical protein VFV38_27295, partial [Ktedonobacteraceae bacterium]|nr:hypothetical protein [Ktedonobacteraceae bacterium]
MTEGCEYAAEQIGDVERCAAAGPGTNQALVLWNSILLTVPSARTLQHVVIRVAHMVAGATVDVLFQDKG